MTKNRTILVIPGASLMQDLSDDQTIRFRCPECRAQIEIAVDAPTAEVMEHEDACGIGDRIEEWCKRTGYGR